MSEQKHPRTGIILNMDGRDDVPINIKLNGRWYETNAHQIVESLQRERQEPEPLTMDALREMNGKPVYIVLIDKTNIANPEDAFDGWGLVRWSWVRMWDAKRADLAHVDHDFCDNGKTWIAYATEPKGEHHD